MPVETPHPEYDAAASGWEDIRDALAGEAAVKSKGVRYLPRLEDQTPDEYQTFLKRAEFYNATWKTVEGLVGVVFRRAPEVILGAGAEMLRPGLDRITRDGLDFRTLAQNVVQEVMSLGRTALLPDRPVEGGTPYIVHYKAEQLINWDVAEVDGTDVATLAVIRETELRPKPTDRFAKVEVTTYRELGLNERGEYTVTIWAKGERDAEFSAGDKFQPTSFHSKPVKGLPLVIAGPQSLTPGVQASPITDIVSVNYHHYRAYADLQHGRHWTAMPIFYAVAPVQSGNDPSAQSPDVTYKVGPNRVWLIEPGADNKPGILEFNGQGLIFLERACDDMERQMAVLGARLLQAPRKSAAEAVEVVQLRERGEQSMLAKIVTACEAALTRVLKLWVEWQGRPSDDVLVRLNRDFTELALEPRMLSALGRLYRDRVLPREIFIQILEEGDILPLNVTAAQVLALLDDPRNLFVDPKVELMEIEAEIARRQANGPAREPVAA